MKTLLILLALTLGVNTLPAADRTLQDLANLFAAERAAQATPMPTEEFVPKQADYPVSEPSAVYSSNETRSITRIPAVYKVDGLPVGLLKWTAAHDLPSDPVVGYEIQADAAPEKVRTYTVTVEHTEFPFTVGMDAMINVVTGEFWKVRAVFASGTRSNWAVSQTFPERFAFVTR